MYCNVYYVNDIKQLCFCWWRQSKPVINILLRMLLWLVSGVILFANIHEGKTRLPDKWPSCKIHQKIYLQLQPTNAPYISGKQVVHIELVPACTLVPSRTYVKETCVFHTSLPQTIIHIYLQTMNAVTPKTPPRWSSMLLNFFTSRFLALKDVSRCQKLLSSIPVVRHI